MGFTVILLTSGEGSVKKAFAEAEKVYSYIREYRSNLVLLEQALSKTPPYFALLDSSGRVVRYKLPSGQEEDLLRELSAGLGDVLRLGSRSSLFRHGGYWSESAERISDGSGKDFAVFYLSPCPSEAEKAPGISVSNEKGPSDFSISTFGRSSVYLKETYEKVRRFAALRAPVLITGEIGTGKDALAKLIHSVGAGSTSFLTLDGASADRSSLESCRQMLQSDETSALYLRQPNLLDPACRQLLFSMLASGGLVINRVRNHLIYFRSLSHSSTSHGRSG